MTIPVPPRSVRWRAALAWRWPLGLVAAALLAATTLLITAFWLPDVRELPFDDLALDSGPEVFQAQVTEIGRRPHTTPTRSFYLVRYTFDLGDGRRRFGASYTEDRFRFSPGGYYDLEYLAARPEINRLAGTLRSTSSAWMPWLLGSFWLPALVVLLWWLRGVLRLRSVLANGPAAVADIVAVNKLRLVNPAHLSVRYRFPDRDGELRDGRHWVRLGSGTGGLLQGDARQMDVVYDDMSRGLSRLVTGGDFAGSLVARTVTAAGQEAAAR